MSNTQEVNLIFFKFDMSDSKKHLIIYYLLKTIALWLCIIMLPQGLILLETRLKKIEIWKISFMVCATYSKFRSYRQINSYF